MHVCGDRVFSESPPSLSHFDQERSTIGIRCRTHLLKTSRGIALIIFYSTHIPRDADLTLNTMKRGRFRNFLGSVRSLQAGGVIRRHLDHGEPVPRHPEPALLVGFVTGDLRHALAFHSVSAVLVILAH
jgi:hypothetical protein